MFVNILRFNRTMINTKHLKSKVGEMVGKPESLPANYDGNNNVDHHALDHIVQITHVFESVAPTSDTRETAK